MDPDDVNTSMSLRLGDGNGCDGVFEPVCRLADEVLVTIGKLGHCHDESLAAPEPVPYHTAVPFRTSFGPPVLRDGVGAYVS